MKQQELINRLRDELTHVVAQTEGNAAMGLTDHNKIAENLICGLMREILGFRGLRNLNASEHANFPAIDLADFGARIAVQVTATATLSKIKGTIGKFLKHGQQGSFDRLVVYILARKQDSYSQESIDNVARPRLAFDGEADIFDFRDLLEKAVHLEPVRLAAALRVVEAYNRGVPAGLAQHRREFIIRRCSEGCGLMDRWGDVGQRIDASIGMADQRLDVAGGHSVHTRFPSGLIHHPR